MRRPQEGQCFCFSIKAISKNISKAEQERLSREVLQTIDQYVLLIKNLGRLFRKITYPMDDNTRVYGACQTVTSSIVFIENNTTTSESPENIHRLKEVARIEAEMLKIAKAQGFNDLKVSNNL